MENRKTIEKLLGGIKIFLQYEEEQGKQGDFGYQRKTKPENLKPGHEQILRKFGWYWNKEKLCWCHPKTTPKRK